MSKKSNCFGCGELFTVLTLKKNNGYCARCAKSSTQNPTKEFPKDSSGYKKIPIPVKLRQTVWLQECGDKFWGNCFTCKMRLNVLEFSCGHIIPESKGGKMEEGNLKVLCKSCNSKMGTENLYEFKKNKYPDVVLVQPALQPALQPRQGLPYTDVDLFQQVSRMSIEDPVNLVRKLNLF